MGMDILSNLKSAKGSRKKVKRIGRGEASGHGGTSTRGHKGARARSGHKFKLWFEGGQMPLTRRIPKFGFKSKNRTDVQIINLETLQRLVETKKITDSSVTPEVLYKIGAISKKDIPVKVLGNGSLKTSLEVKAHAFSKSAISKIEAAGGKTIIIDK